MGAATRRTISILFLFSSQLYTITTGQRHIRDTLSHVYKQHVLLHKTTTQQTVMEAVAGAITSASNASPTFKKFLQQLTRKNLSRALVVYILAVIFKYRNTAYGVKPRPDLKGPRGHPLIGNMILMALTPRNQVSQQNERMHEEYGSTWSFSVPKLGRIIQFKDPAVLEHVLKTNFWAYEKGPLIQETLSDLLGLGIFGADGHVGPPFLSHTVG